MGEVHGSNTSFLSIAEAKSKIYQYSEFNNWIEERSFKNISKIKDGQHYILCYDGWRKTSKELFYSLKKTYFYEMIHSDFKNGQWNFVFISKDGPPPYRISIILDGVTGEVVDFQTFEK